MQKTYTISEVCSILNKSKSTVYRYLKQNKLRGTKYKGRYQISEIELEKFITENSKKEFINKSKQFNSMVQLHYFN